MEQTIAREASGAAPQYGEGSRLVVCGGAERSIGGAANSELTTETVTDAAAFFSLEHGWNELALAANLDHPFLTHQWIRTWWEAFEAGSSLHIILIRAGGELVGIAPFMLARRKYYGVSLRSIEFIANDHSPRQGFLVASRFDEVVEAIWTALLRQQSLWDVLMLRQLPADSPLLTALSALARQEKRSCALWPSGDSPYLPIAGTWDQQFQRLDSKHRQNMRRRLKRLGEVGAVALERVAGGTKLEGALEDGLRIEGAAWKDENGTSIRSSAETKKFYTALAERFGKQGWLDLNFLTVAERRIAFNYCVRYRNKIYLLKPGYDPGLASYSPVNLLCYLSLQEAFAAGAEEFDFLGIEDEWKRDWTRMSRRNVWLFIFSRSPRALLIFFAKFRLRPALRKMPLYGPIRSRVVEFAARLRGRASRSRSAL